MYNDNASLLSASCFSFCFVKVAIAFVLATLSDNLLPFNHSKSLVRSLLNCIIQLINVFISIGETIIISVNCYCEVFDS